jgi:hypothetical protein
VHDVERFAGETGGQAGEGCQCIEQQRDFDALLGEGLAK